MLAETSGHAGQAEAGLTMLAEALTLVDTMDERHYEAELHRLQGALVLQARYQSPGPAGRPVPAAEAEACFHQALAVARRQHAKALELRAAISLARLWQQQGQRAEAYALLAPLYGWFTEGWDAADLLEAKAVLEDLGE